MGKEQQSNLDKLRVAGDVLSFMAVALFGVSAALADLVLGQTVGKHGTKSLEKWWNKLTGKGK